MPTTLPAAFRNLWLGIHIFMALLGYAALTLMFCAGVMYLMQESQLKSKRPGALYHRLPSLSLLDDLNGRALILGFPLLTQGIITGSVWGQVPARLLPALEPYVAAPAARLDDVRAAAGRPFRAGMARQEGRLCRGGGICRGARLLFRARLVTGDG